MVRGLAIGVVPIVVVLSGGCGDDGETVDVNVACEQLSDLAEEVLALGETTEPAEIGARLRPAVDAFGDAAHDSGDERLAELADTYEGRLEVYLGDPSAEAQAAGQSANAALDEAGARCLELGYADPFPEEP